MLQIIKKGTATRHLKNSKVKLAAKTGTAQVISIPQSEKSKNEKRVNLNIIIDHTLGLQLMVHIKQKEKYVVTILVEHGGHGGSAAGEMVSGIYNSL